MNKMKKNEYYGVCVKRYDENINNIRVCLYKRNRRRTGIRIYET